MNRNNPFDKASRYLLKMSPVEFITWATGQPSIGERFQRWIDTRRVVLPGESDRISDLVAEIERDLGDYWAVICEVNRSSQADMFGRMLVYQGLLWLEIRPTNQRGERYGVTGMVINLTGRGNSSRRFELTDTMFTHLAVREIDLIDYTAVEVLNRIEAGTDPMILLPWIPLMRDGSDAEIRSRWKEIASRESEPKRRADFGSLVLTFADLAGTLESWQQTLEGWNVEVSTYVSGIEQRAEQKAEQRVEKRERRNFVVKLLDLRFPGMLTPVVRDRILSANDADVVDQLLASAETCSDFASFVSVLDSMTK